MSDKTLEDHYHELLLLRIEVAEAEKQEAANKLHRMKEKQKERGRK